MSTTSSADPFRTTNMVLATILTQYGMPHASLERMDRNCVWVYAPDSRIDEVVKQFHDNEIKVEPKAFASAMARVRSEMYSHMGVGERRTS